MEAADPALPLKVRPFWEAVDAGVLLARQWWAPLFAFYLLPVAALDVGLVLLLGTETPALTLLVLWWLRPLGDRLVLGWVGERFFRPRAGWGVLVQKTLRSLDASFWADLTWRRFSPSAAFLAPLSFLEGGSQNERGRRRKWLNTGMNGPLVLLATAAAVAEGAVALSLWVSASSVFSPGLWGAGAGFDGSLTGLWWVVLGAGAQLLVQPLYVLSCFSLYVGTRTRKEGWDLALAFRSLRARLVRKAPLLVLVLTLGLLVPSGAEAQAFVPPDSEGSAPPQAQTWSKIVEGRDFGYEENTWGLKWKGPREKPKSGEPALPSGEWSAEIIRGVALTLGVVVLAALAGYGLWTALGRSAGGRPRTRSHGEDVLTPLRPVWSQDVMALWSQGRAREALAALYRAALNQASAQGLNVPAAATEGDCLRVLASSPDPAFAAAAARLVSMWSNMAWGGRLPTDESFQASVDALRASGAKP